MSTVTMKRTHDGLRQLERRWPAHEPWAVVMLVHGVAEHSGRYEGVGEALAAEGVEAVSFDHRGFGRTEGTRAYVDRFEQYLEDLSLRMEDAKTDLPLCLLGHSLGGLIALRYTLEKRAPAPARLILSAPSVEAQAPLWQKLSAPVLSRRLPKLPVPSPVRVDQLSRNPAVGEEYEADPLVYQYITPRLGSETLTTMAEVRRALGELDVPALVLHGGDDTLVPTRSSEALGTLPDVTRKVYPGLRHELFNEPEGPSVLADVVAWLRREIGEVRSGAE